LCVCFDWRLRSLLKRALFAFPASIAPYGTNGCSAPCQRNACRSRLLRVSRLLPLRAVFDAGKTADRKYLGMLTASAAGRAFLVPSSPAAPLLPTVMRLQRPTLPTAVTPPLCDDSSGGHFLAGVVGCLLPPPFRILNIPGREFCAALHPSTRMERRRFQRHAIRRSLHCLLYMVGLVQLSAYSTSPRATPY